MLWVAVVALPIAGYIIRVGSTAVVLHQAGRRRANSSAKRHRLRTLFHEVLVLINYRQSRSLARGVSQGVVHEDPAAEVKDTQDKQKKDRQGQRELRQRLARS